MFNTNYYRIIFYLCLLSTIFVTLGCDKLPKASELGKQTPPPTPPKTTEPILPPEVETPEPEPPKTPEQLISEFRAKKPMEIDDQALIEITNLPEAVEVFESLDLSNSRVTDQGLASLNQLTNLRELNLKNSQVQGRSLGELQSLKHLESLNLDATPFDSTSGEAIQNFESLRKISLRGTGVNDNFYTHLGELTQLEELHLDDNKNIIGRNFADLVAKEKFPELKVLTAGNTKFGHYGLLSVDRLKNLEVLKIQDGGLNLKSIVPISKCNQLKELNLSGNPLSNEALGPFKRLKKLEVLNLTQCQGISDPAIQTLRTMNQLKSLHIGGTMISSKGIEALQKGLKNTEIIQ